MNELQIIIIGIVAIIVGAAAMYFLPKLFSSPSKDPVKAKCPDNCSNNGLCLPDGTCKCDKGYMGYNCSKEDKPVTCPSNCSGNGTCTNGTCLCNQGFGGNDCSKVICPIGYAGPGCLNCDKEGGFTFDPKNPGTCIIDRCSPQCSPPSGHCDDAAVGTCSCNPGYFGPTCQVSCKNNAKYDYRYKKCICPPGFGGSDCSLECKKGTFKIGDIPLPTSYCNTTLGAGKCDQSNGTCECINNGAFSASEGCGFSGPTQLGVDLVAGVLEGIIKGQCSAMGKDPTTAVGEFMRRWSQAKFDTGQAAKLFQDACNCGPNEIDYNPDTKTCRPV